MLVGFQALRLREVEGDEGFEIAKGLPVIELAVDASEVLAPAEGSHRLVSIVGDGYAGDGKFLALFSSEAGEDPLLELDEAGNPLPGSEASLEAVARATALVEGQAPGLDEVREELQQIWELVSEDSNAALGELLFERLYRWAEGGQTVDDLPGLFWLLPWGPLAAHLSRLRELLDRDKAEDPSSVAVDDSPLPDISHLFRYLVPGLAPALREITEWRDDPGAEIASAELHAFTRRMGRIAPEQLPPTARVELIETADAIGRRLVHRLWEWTSSSDHLLVALVMASVYQFLLNLDAPFEGSVEDGRRKWMGRIAVAAKAGYYPDGKLRLRQRTVQAMMEAADSLAAEMTTLLADPPRDPRERDRLLDAGYILQFAASTALGVTREPARALELAAAARRAFEEFGNNPLPYRIVRWANILPETFLLEARSATAASDPHRAVEPLTAMWQKLPDLRGQLKRHTLELYRAELLLEASQVEEADAVAGEQLCRKLGIPPDGLIREALGISESIIGANFSNRKAWRIFLAHGDDERAIQMIEETVEQTSGDELGTPELETREWLEYQMALKARQRSESMPELVLDAFDAYVRLLASQPTNTVALAETLDCYSELRDFEVEDAKATLDRVLVPVEDEGAPPTHAALRWAIRDELPPQGEVRTAAQAIPVLGAGTADQPTLDAARAVIEKEVKRRKLVSMALEIVSKWIYDEARMVGDRDGLRTVARLLDPAIDGRPDDAVWWTRRVDIAITEGDVEVAEKLMTGLESRFSDDPIAHFQRARLLMMKGQLDGADRALIEASFLNREATEEDAPHPAILDRRGFIALREGRYPDAEELYLRIIAEDNTDSIAHYGLGRVYLESPERTALDVLAHWRLSLRLRAAGARSNSVVRSPWQPAVGIAGLVSGQLRRTPDSEMTHALLEGLQELVLAEDAAACRYLINALRVRGVTDRRTATVIRRARSQGVSQSIAQYLMARAIHVYLESPEAWPAFVAEELPGDVAWCRDRQVLGDFLAGAKGSYARAAMRAKLQASEVPSWHNASPPGAKKLRKLVDHVVETAYSATYYTSAYQYLEAARGATNEQLVGVACEIITRISDANAARVAEERSADALIASLEPVVGLETIGDVVGLEQNAGALTGFVDFDALLYAQRAHGLDAWKLSGANLVTVAPVEVPFEYRYRYSRAGIDWKLTSSPDLPDLVHGCVSLLPPGGEERSLDLAAAGSDR